MSGTGEKEKKKPNASATGVKKAVPTPVFGDDQKPKVKTPPDKTEKTRAERRAERTESGAPVGWRDLDSIRPQAPQFESRAKQVKLAFFLSR